MDENKTILSAVIIASNAEHHIRKTLDSLKFTDQIVVVINPESKDKTEHLARESGAEVYINPWEGFGAQKNFGMSKATGEWLLFVDADEEVPSELGATILDTINSPGYDFYWIRIITFFLNKPLNHLFGHNPRLFKKSAGRWSTEEVHEQVVINQGQKLTLGDQHSGLIKEPLLHYSHPTIKSYLKKMQHYTTLDAKQMNKTGQHRSGRPVSPSASLPFQLAGRQFIKLLFYRSGILDGYAGIVWCILSAYYEYTMSKKYLALSKLN